MKLYEIPAGFAELDFALTESGGELTPELEKQFDEFLRSSKDKLEAGVMVVRGLELEASACKQEAQRLTARATSLDNNADRLKKLVLYALDTAFAGKVKTALFTIWGQTSAGTVNVDLAPGTALESLPEKLVRVKRELAKDVVKEMVKTGEALPDEIIVTNMPGTRFLRVK